MLIVQKDQFPRLITVISMLLAFAFLTLDGIDGRHAKRTRYSTLACTTFHLLLLLFCPQLNGMPASLAVSFKRNASPIGELFALCCDNVATVFFALIACSIVGIKVRTPAW